MKIEEVISYMKEDFKKNDCKSIVCLKILSDLESVQQTQNELIFSCISMIKNEIRKDENIMYTNPFLKMIVLSVESIKGKLWENIINE